MKKEKFYSSIRLHKDDIREIGFDPDKLDDDDMERIAEKIGEACMDTWWNALEYMCEEYELPRNENRL